MYFFPSFDSLWFAICICNKKKSKTSNKNKTLVCRRKNSNVSSRSEKNCATNREGPKIDWRAEIGHSHKFKRVMKSSTWKIDISRRIYHKNAGPVLRKPAWFIVHFKNVSSQFHFLAIPPIDGSWSNRERQSWLYTVWNRLTISSCWMYVKTVENVHPYFFRFFFLFLLYIPWIDETGRASY